MTSCDPLPPKESALYKRIHKCYENKQYKIGLKFAKQILSNPRYSAHGETLAMKGLTLNCLGRKEEAYENVKRGLKFDLKSNVCWHAYGMLQRSDRKYEEAIKCYRNALKLEKDNIQILRDLSWLQIQMRDLEGFRDTRYQHFLLRPTQRASWIGYAMACHLLKDYDICLKILDSFRETFESRPRTLEYDYEYSEFLLYQNMVIQESGNTEGALIHLMRFKEHICDKVLLGETFTDLFMKLGWLDDAHSQLQSLINQNQENELYYTKLAKVLDLKTDDEYVDLLGRFIESYPKASVPKRLILKYTHGDRFKKEIDEYLKTGFRKGKPSLFAEIRSLYSDKPKVKIISELLESYIDNLMSSGCLSELDKKENGVTKKVKEPASCLLWGYYFMAQHNDLLGDSSRAIYYINAAIKHSPTLADLYVMKAKIYKHAGDVFEAYKWLEEAQDLDTADRFLNSKCAKYMLRANLIKEAEAMSSKFTRGGVPAMENLNEMQCLWFQTECALAYERLGNLGEALKKCHEVDRHFTEITEDQYEFHSYCVRKMTLRSYIGLLRLEDVLRSHSFYQKAARCAINVYISLHDRPLIKHKSNEELFAENLTPSELKKLRSKQRKAQRKAELQAETNPIGDKKETQKKPRQKDSEDYLPQYDIDPEKLTLISDPLVEAIKFLQPLQRLCPAQVETHILAYEIYSRKEKPLLMLQSVKRAFKTNENNPKVHSMLIKFSQQMLKWESSGSLSEAVHSVIKKQMEPILLGRTPLEINSSYLKSHSDSLLEVLEGAKMMYFLDKSRQNEALRLLLDMDLSSDKFTLNSCMDVLNALKSGDLGNCEDAVETFCSLCNARFPYAQGFLKSTKDALIDRGNIIDTSPCHPEFME